MTRPSRDEGDAKLLVEAIEALRELVSRALEANDRTSTTANQLTHGKAMNSEQR